MDATSTSTSRFRFRDHNQQMIDDESSEGHTTADSSSVSSFEDQDLELQSMTARGVQHLCSELLELKQESDEDFQKNIFSNYFAFLAILKELEALQSELLGLKKQASLQKKLIKDVSDGISLPVFSEETINSILEETLLVQPSKLEMHTEKVTEIFDTLISEHRLDDALALLQMESDFFENLQSTEYSSDQIMSYNSTISEKRAMLSDQLKFVAKHPRISAPELQKALFGLCQLGDNHLAAKLLLQYYHSRITSGIYDLQSLKELLDVSYIHEASKFVCSMISQAVSSYVDLNGETYPYPSELTQWATREIEVFAVFFNKYIESISDISGRLSTAVDALKIAMSFCSLLETQRIFLQPSLTECIRPCIQEVLELHIDHLSKVVSIVASTDTWVLSRCYASGILKGTSYTIIDQQPEYFFLTNSGRKFMTLFQFVAEDTSPLVAYQMESSVLKGLVDLFTAYIIVLESAITGDTDVMEKGGYKINLPESPTQGVFVLANLSTLMQFSFSFIRNFFDGIHQLNFEIDNYTMFIQDVYNRLKACFLDQFISNIFSPKVEHESSPDIRVCIQDDSRICDLIPSVPYLELYLEVKKLEKLAEDDCLDMNWLVCLFREMMDAVFEWISSKSEIWTISEENVVDNRTKFIQLILDSQFLVEIGRRGEYLSDNTIKISKDIASRLEASFISAGLIPLRDWNDGEWGAKAVEKLQQVHAKERLQNENASDREDEEQVIQNASQNQVSTTD
ncbi:hypothetical protein ACS0TY_007281 [Phlomoides rotata]